MTIIINRRPLKTRDWKITRYCARWLTGHNITPNQISIASILCSGLTAACILCASLYDFLPWFLYAAAVFFMFARACCNLFDGMVAVEGGKSTPAGELFNDIPDRISDSLVLIAAGYVTAEPALGWCAALLAVMTAYIRTLARSIGAPPDFQGPMAKTHRMAVMAISCLLTFVWPEKYVFTIGLTVIILGCGLTIINRTRAAFNFLERND